MRARAYVAALYAFVLSTQAAVFAQPRPVTIVELFTSEGCSSCPPADALLQKVHLTTGPTGQLIVGISEHVTYWNRLGWQDPFSQEKFTERQTVYADHLAAGGPYTPQMVVNGRTQFVGSDSAALARALQDEAKRSHASLEILEAVNDGDSVKLRFSVSGAMQKPLDVMAVLTDETGQSRVLRGENAGRSLQHVSVARLFMRIASVSGNGEQTVRVPLPRGLQKAKAGQRLIVFAQEPGQGAIVGADVKQI